MKQLIPFPLLRNAKVTEEHSTSTIERAVQDGLKSSLVGIGSNLALAGFKCVAGFLGHSFA